MALLLKILNSLAFMFAKHESCAFDFHKNFDIGRYESGPSLECMALGKNLAEYVGEAINSINCSSDSAYSSHRGEFMYHLPISLTPDVADV